MDAQFTTHWDDEDTLVLTIHGVVGITTPEAAPLTVDGKDTGDTPSLEFAAQEVALNIQRSEIPALKAAIDAIKEPVPA